MKKFIKGPTGIWTRVNRFKVCGANRYTMRPKDPCLLFLFWFFIFFLIYFSHKNILIIDWLSLILYTSILISIFSVIIMFALILIVFAVMDTRLFLFLFFSSVFRFYLRFCLMLYPLSVASLCFAYPSLLYPSLIPTLYYYNFFKLFFA